MKTRLLIGAASAALLASCAHSPSMQAPAVQARTKALLTVDGLKYRFGLSY